MPHFECGAFNRSATSPRPKGRAPRSVGRYVANAARRDKGRRGLDGHSLDRVGWRDRIARRRLWGGRLRPIPFVASTKVSGTRVEFFTETGCEGLTS